MRKEERFCILEKMEEIIIQKGRNSDALRVLGTRVKRFAQEIKLRENGGVGEISDSVVFSTIKIQTDGWIYVCIFSTGCLQSDKARLKSSSATY